MIFLAASANLAASKSKAGRFNLPFKLRCRSPHLTKQARNYSILFANLSRIRPNQLYFKILMQWQSLLTWSKSRPHAHFASDLQLIYALLLSLIQLHPIPIYAQKRTNIRVQTILVHYSDRFHAMTSAKRQFRTSQNRNYVTTAVLPTRNHFYRIHLGNAGHTWGKRQNRPLNIPDRGLPTTTSRLFPVQPRGLIIVGSFIEMPAPPGERSYNHVQSILLDPSSKCQPPPGEWSQNQVQRHYTGSVTETLAPSGEWSHNNRNSKIHYNRNLKGTFSSTANLSCLSSTAGLLKVFQWNQNPLLQPKSVSSKTKNSSHFIARSSFN